MEYIQVMTTIDEREAAENIAHTLVSKRLAACVQVVGPISSTYWWQNKVEHTEEWLCIIKTKRSLYKKLEATIKQLHTYEVPEILAIPVADGYEGYIKWLEEYLKLSQG